MSRWLRGRNVRRDYSRKSFSNPLFEPSRTGRDGRKRWRARIILIVGLAAIGGWTWFVAFSPAFRITDIQVRGTDRIPSWEVQDAVAELLKERRWLLLPKTSVLVISEENIVDTLNERFVLESLDVTKRPPHTLLIELRERVFAVFL